MPHDTHLNMLDKQNIVLFYIIIYRQMTINIFFLIIKTILPDFKTAAVFYCIPENLDKFKINSI